MNYIIEKSETIIQNQKEFVKECYKCKERLDILGVTDTTWDYSKYNMFHLTNGNGLFWNLYKEVCSAARKYINDDGPLWMQSWMNFHKHDKVLDWHNHDWEFHGYISIDPKKTKTVFDEWEVENEIGNIYIGPGYHNHKVEVLEQYTGYRITLGIDFYRETIPKRNILIPVC